MELNDLINIVRDDSYVIARSNAYRTHLKKPIQSVPNSAPESLCASIKSRN